MKQRKIPMRKDVVSNEMRPKKEMIRVVRDSDGILSIDPTGKKSGRGAYIAIDPEIAKEAQQRKVFERVFDVKVDSAFYEELIAYTDHQKARQELFGQTK